MQGGKSSFVACVHMSQIHLYRVPIFPLETFTSVSARKVRGVPLSRVHLLWSLQLFAPRGGQEGGGGEDRNFSSLSLCFSRVCSQHTQCTRCCMPRMCSTGTDPGQFWLGAHFSRSTGSGVNPQRVTIISMTAPTKDSFH